MIHYKQLNLYCTIRMVETIYKQNLTKKKTRFIVRKLSIFAHTTHTNAHLFLQREDT
jgi:hypothetical protein